MFGEIQMKDLYSTTHLWHLAIEIIRSACEEEFIFGIKFT